MEQHTPLRPAPPSALRHHASPSDAAPSTPLLATCTTGVLPRCRLSPDGSAYELVAVAPITPGAEISISYSGVEVRGS